MYIYIYDIMQFTMGLLIYNFNESIKRYEKLLIMFVNEEMNINTRNISFQCLRDTAPNIPRYICIPVCGTTLVIDNRVLPDHFNYF